MNKKSIGKFFVSSAMFIGLLINSQMVSASEKDNWQRYYPDYKMSYYLNDVSSDKKITITFSKGIDKSSISARNIELMDSDFQNEISVDFKFLDDTKLQIVPRQSLKSGQTYFLIVHDGVKDLNGNGMKTGIVSILKVKSAPITPPIVPPVTPPTVPTLPDVNFEMPEKDPNKINFVQDVIPGAVDGYKKYKVLPSITVAQSILESAWGTSDKAIKCNNLFGVKAKDEWTGPFLELPTKEWEDGKVIEIMDKWRVYSNINESIEDHGKHIAITPCYKQNGVFDALNYKDQANALSKAGYATDPQYAEKLCSIISRYSLWKLDPNGENIK